MATFIALLHAGLAGVFAVAAIGKLVDVRGSVRSLVDFSIPQTIARPLALLLPAAELLLAFGLLTRRFGWQSAAGACALLLLYTLGLAVTLARGRRPACHCFGQLSSGEIGMSTLVRTATLAIMAAFLIWAGRQFPQRTAYQAFIALSGAAQFALTSTLVLASVLALLGKLVFELLREQTQLLQRLNTLEERLAAAGVLPLARYSESDRILGLPIGVPAPFFQPEEGDLNGAGLEWRRLSSRPSLLVFTDAECTACQSLMPDLAAWGRAYRRELNCILVGSGLHQKVAALDSACVQVVGDTQGAIRRAFKVQSIPAAVVIAGDGTVASAVIYSPDGIRAFLKELVAEDVPSSAESPALLAQRV